MAASNSHKYGVPFYGASWVPPNALRSAAKNGDDAATDGSPPSIASEDYLVFAGGGGEGRSGIPNAVVVSYFDFASNSLSDQPAETVVMRMAEEIKLWKGKADTLLMDWTEYEEDLKVVFKMLKEKEEIEVKDKEIQKWVVKLANAGRRHAKEMKTLRDDMMIEAAKSVFEARIEMIKEYQGGEHINWNLEEENAALQMIIGEKTGEVTSKAQERIEQAGDAQDSNTE